MITTSTLAEVAAAKDAIIDLEICVDDARHDVDAAVAVLRTRVQARDAAVWRLKRLLERALACA